MVKRWTYTPPSEEIWKKLRASDVTSTESAALFDASPYLTAFELFYRKLARFVIDQPWNERMRWGQRLQDVIARGIAEDQGVRIRAMNQYQRLVQVRMGSSFDYEVIGLVDGSEETPMRAMYREFGVGNFEIKCVDYSLFRNYWTVNDDRSIEAPTHIEIQVQHQLHVSARPWSAIGVLVGGNQPRIVIRHRDEEVGNLIESRIVELYRRVKTNQPPDPVFPADAELLCKLHGYAEPGRIYDGRNDAEIEELCEQYRIASAQEKAAAEDKETAKAKILHKIGTAERAWVHGFSVSASVVPAKEIAYVRAAYRNLRITAKDRKPVAA